MSRPLHRGVSGARVAQSSRVTAVGDSWDSQMKDRTDKEDADCRTRSPVSSLSLPFLVRLWPKHFDYAVTEHSPAKSSSRCGNDSFSESGLGSDPKEFSSRNRQRLPLLLLMCCLFLIVVLALCGSSWWTLSISSSSSSRGNIYRGYRRLHEQVILDLSDIGVLSLGLVRLKEAEFCPEDFDNFVPCFNVSENRALGYTDGDEFDRHCRHRSLQSCLVLPPKNYRIPLRWPTGKDVIWINNVKITAQEVLSSGSLTKRLMLLEEDQISFRSDSSTVAGVEDYSHQIAEMIGLRNESNLIHAGVRTVLDIGCGYGSFGAHLFSKQLLIMCIANYESSGSQVQLTLERGLPAMVGSFTSKQLPYPSLSFDMIHCARCGIDWEKKDGVFLIEVDRVLMPGGYFVWTSPLTNTQGSLRNKEKLKKWMFVRDFTESLCWDMLSQQDETVVWKKTSQKNCYASRNPGVGPPICSKRHDVESPYYLPILSCIGGTRSRRWVPIEERSTWPSRVNLNSDELDTYGVHAEDFAEDALNWNTMIRNYWSLLSPLIFSDHPKRPGDEDPSPPFNMLRNVLDMNARFGGFNAALLDAGKTVWVMNVVPTNSPNYLPLLLGRGFIGVLHDWCEAFPTYPRTYDMVHAEGLFSLDGQRLRCSMLDLFLEVDRILRPEGWVILRDTASHIEAARSITTQLRWDPRVVEIERNSEDRLLVCQKPFLKRQF